MTTTRMYLACTSCKRGDNGALFIRSLSQFLEVQLAKGLWLLCIALGKRLNCFGLIVLVLKQHLKEAKCISFSLGSDSVNIWVEFSLHICNKPVDVDNRFAENVLKSVDSGIIVT